MRRVRKRPGGLFPDDWVAQVARDPGPESCALMSMKPRPRNAPPAVGQNREGDEDRLVRGRPPVRISTSIAPMKTIG